jgi:hypothetical protein
MAENVLIGVLLDIALSLRVIIVALVLISLPHVGTVKFLSLSRFCNFFINFSISNDEFGHEFVTNH